MFVGYFLTFSLSNFSWLRVLQRESVAGDLRAGDKGRVRADGEEGAGSRISSPIRGRGGGGGRDTGTTSVADPYHFDTDPDPGCEKFVTDPDPG